MIETIFKLTPQVRKRLSEINNSLPKIPLFTKQGKILRKATHKKISGKELFKTTDKLSDGTKVYIDKNYVQHGTKLVLVNHMVNLRESYKRNGNDGVESYIAQVNNINLQIQKAQNGRNKQKT